MNNWHDIFEYDNGFLYWKGKKGKCNAGDLAGCIHKNSGYWVVRVNDKLHKVHRIIWEMHNGPIPKGCEIDHIWHNRNDNRIENLRLVTHKQNGRNQAKPKNNKSGQPGVHKLSDGYYRAEICVNGKNVHLGRFDNFEDAVDARKKGEKKYCFHENNGVSKEILMREFEFTLPWAPSVNSYYGNNKRGSKYVTNKGKDFQKKVKEIIESLKLDLNIDFNVSVYIYVAPPTLRPHDIDNCLKAIFDSLTYAHFWVDDRQVFSLKVVKCHKIKNGQIFVKVKEHSGVLPDINEYIKNYWEV